MSDGNSLAQRIRKLVSEQLGVEHDVELVMAIEESFDIEIPDEAMDSLRTIGDVESYVSARAAA